MSKSEKIMEEFLKEPAQRPLKLVYYLDLTERKLLLKYSLN